MDLAKEWEEHQEKERAEDLAGEIEIELAILVIKERSGRNIYKTALFVMVLLLPSFWAISGHSLREDISLAILTALFGTAVLLFVKGYAETGEAQKDLSAFLDKCAESQDPNIQTALIIVVRKGNFPAWEQQILDARRKNWEAKRMKQNPPSR